MKFKLLIMARQAQDYLHPCLFYNFIPQYFLSFSHSLLFCSETEKVVFHFRALHLQFLPLERYFLSSLHGWFLLIILVASKRYIPRDFPDHQPLYPKVSTSYFGPYQTRSSSKPQNTVILYSLLSRTVYNLYHSPCVGETLIRYIQWMPRALGFNSLWSNLSYHLGYFLHSIHHTL